VVVSGWHGLPFERPIQRLRETVEIVRVVLARKRLVYEGQIFKLDGGIRLVSEPIRSWVPIYLVALSPHGLRLTGEIADGWLGAFFSPSQYTEIFEPHLQRGWPGEVRMLGQCRFASTTGW
jgi:alkanesulfonate monooxygenase SsuD/methylene tetrahydromethanopterin reductase-like flavin-dependent oxidoreductase (luciferase family)